MLTDLRLPGINGLDLIRAIRERELPVTVIVMTGYATVESAVEAMKLGAYDLILKPIDTIRLEVVVNQALEDRRLIDEVADLRCRLRKKYAYHNLLGRSPRMMDVFERVARVASSSCTVLVTGETGTGKELVAQAIHFSDVTRRGTLRGRQLRGLARAPAGERAVRPRARGVHRGRPPEERAVRAGRRGDALPRRDRRDAAWAMQAKLLRVLQDGRFERVGGTEPIQTDCRVVAATNVNLAEAVAAGRFREDLFYRLNVISIELPPLRERLEDIPLLVDHFLEKLTGRGLPSRTVSRLALSRLLTYDWPGNVRELEHVIEQAMVTTPGPVIEPENLPPQIVARHDEPFTLDFDHRRPLPEITAEFTRRIERAYLQRVLEKYRGRVELCAKHCGLSRRSISEKLRRYQIDKRDFKPHAPVASNSPWRETCSPPPSSVDARRW